MAPFEALYGRKCRTPLCWFQDGESVLIELELIQKINEKVKMIQERLKNLSAGKNLMQIKEEDL